MLWDFKIQTDQRIDHNKPDIVVFEKQSRSCTIIDIACPFDTRVNSKEREKVENYQDLKRELYRLWKCKEVNIIPVVVEALRMVPKGLPRLLEKLRLTCLDLLQKACLLGTARILRRVLDTEVRSKLRTRAEMDKNSSDWRVRTPKATGSGLMSIQTASEVLCFEPVIII